MRWLSVPAAFPLRTRGQEKGFSSRLCLREALSLDFSKGMKSKV